jgi:hypothetical protein
VRIPGLRQDLDPELPADVFYACMAETLLMALEPSARQTSVGPANATLARSLMKVARKHGFEPTSICTMATHLVGSADREPDPLQI